MGKRPASKQPAEVELSTAEGALRLWSSIAQGLRQAGYDRVGPEYLRLSRLLAQQRGAELLAGKRATAGEWGRIQAAAAEVVALLEPLSEAARLLARLPQEAPRPAPPPRRRLTRTVRRDHAGGEEPRPAAAPPPAEAKRTKSPGKATAAPARRTKTKARKTTKKPKAAKAAGKRKTRTTARKATRGGSRKS